MRSILLCGLVLFCGVAANAYAGKIELTTYYPAPYGEYEEVKANALKVGSSDAIDAGSDEAIANYKPRTSPAGNGNEGDFYYKIGEGFKYSDGTAWKSFGSQPLVQNIVGYRAYGDKLGVLSYTGAGAAPAFADVFQKIDTAPNPGPVPFNTAQMAKGIQCRSENGWYLTGCSFANIGGGGNNYSDWDAVPYNNGCYSGSLDDASNSGGVTIECVRVTT